MAENNTPIKNFSSAGAEKLLEMTENNNTYIDFLKFQGRVFKHSTSVALEFFAQRPETKLIATKEQWAMANCNVAQGSEAIRFLNTNGKITDFYDFSQVEETTPPYQWSMNKNNANEVKKQLGIPEKMPIISGVINSTVKPSDITACMYALGVPPNHYKEFSKSYINAIQLIIAGRLEVGGNNFNIPSDLTALQMLKANSQKLAFLTHASNTARKSLMIIEKAVQNLNTMERIEKNDLREMENFDIGRTAERSGRRTSDNTAGIAEKQSDRSQGNENEWGSRLGNNTESSEWKEHKMVSGIQNENSEQSGILVQVRPDMGTLQPESDRIRTVNGGRTNRNLWTEMDGLHGGTLSASGGRNEAVSQILDSSPFSEQQSGELQRHSGRPVRRDESTTNGFRGSSEVGTSKNVSLGQHGDERNSFSSGDRSLEDKLNTVFLSENTEKTSTEKADVFIIDDDISDEEALLHITTEIAEKEKQFTDLVNASERRYDLISDTANEIQKLQKMHSALKEKIQKNPITMEDIQTLRDIRPVRKSVQNMLEHEVAQTSKLEKLLHSEMGNKSPYEQRKNNDDWRKDNSKSIKITQIQPKDLPKRINDIRQKENIKKIERGSFKNSDTNMEIVFGKKSIDEITAKAIQDDKRNIPVEARIAALYQMQELVENAVCFDSQVSEYDNITSKNKSPNTLFMHKMYGILNYKNENYLAKLSVEESYVTDKENNFSGTSNRIYNLRNIKITPIEANRIFSPTVNSENATEDTPTSVFISIPQLYDIVKTYDKNYFENPEAVGRSEREAELYLQAEYNDAVAETVGNSTHSEKSELLENVAESRKITKEKAEEVLQQNAEKLTIKRSITLSERKKILNDFAKRNGLGKIQIWKKTGSPSSYRIAETENGDRLFNEQLCTLGKGEVLTAEKLHKSIDEFEKSEFFIQYEQTKSKKIEQIEEQRKLYSRFIELFPNVINGQHKYEQYGELIDNPFSAEHIENDIYKYMHFSIQRGEKIPNPEYTFKLNHEKGELEILQMREYDFINEEIKQRNPDNYDRFDNLRNSFIFELSVAKNKNYNLTEHIDNSVKTDETQEQSNNNEYDLNIQDYIDYYDNLPPEQDDEPEDTPKRTTFGNLREIQEYNKYYDEDEFEDEEDDIDYDDLSVDDDTFEPEEINHQFSQENFSKYGFNIQDYENIAPEYDEQSEKKKSTAEELYNQFTETFPEISSGEHSYERYKNIDDELEPLSVEHLGGNNYAFMHDAKFKFELDHENKTLNILECQKNDSVFGTNTDLELLSSLENIFAQNLKNAQDEKRQLTLYADKNGNKFNSDNEPVISEIEETKINDNTPKLRAVLNEFSEKYGLGELNVTPNNYNWTLTEKFQDGTDFKLGEITSSEYDKPFTPQELKTSLEKFESEKQNISEIYNRKSMVENHGGISVLPKVQKNLPEITYANKPSEKVNNNLSAIREMIRLEKAQKSGLELYNKYNSKELSEHNLRKYCGWGGLPQVFDERFKQYEYQRNELKKLLTPEEYAEAKSSTLNAHYTPQIIIDAMYKAVQNMNLPRDAKILEPACGTGNFITRLPHSFSDAKVTGIELDSVTARIAKQINHDNENIHIINSGFENSSLENNSFDLAIGNVPFSDYNMNDPDYVQDWKIHDAFFRKALDKVSSGGVVAFVTSTGTMDKSNPKIREYLATQAELIGAIRLPDNAFSEAGTGVSSDIIFLKKRENPLSIHEPKPDWCYTIPDKNGLKINSYFVQNPQMMLGEMQKTTFQNRLTCKAFEGADLENQLNEAIKNLNAKITIVKREKSINEQRGKVEPWGKNFTFQIKDDKVYYRKNNQMEEIKVTSAEKEKIAKLCEIRDVTRNLIDLQKTSISDEKLVPIREKLNKLYDEYRSEHGELSSKQVKKLFSNDSDFPILQSLENHNKESRKTEKADIFFRRTVNPMLEIKSVENIEEALQISLDRKGKPDIPYMAILLDQPPEKVCNELLEKGQIFIDPEKELPDKKFSGVVERSEYLSGNVRMKLTLAEEYAKSNPEYNRNIQALKNVIPEDITAKEISVQMGCSWIEPEDYTEFLEHLSGRASYNSRRCDVSYSQITGEFSVLNAGSKQSLNLNETTTYGTSDYNMYQLAEKILNQRRIAVQREKISPKDPSKTVTRTDPKATKVALEKAKLIRAEFEKWIFADEKRKVKYERKYNDIFNSIVGRNYDGSHLSFAGMNNNFILRPHQKNCVARAIYGGNTLAAHVVGAGKSAVIFTSVMKKKELGLINKACVVVPKALTEQTANEWRKVYPDAKILTVTNDDLSNETKRNLFTAKVATGSYDAVILSQEQFEKIPMSKNYRVEFIKKELDSLEDMLREKKLQNNGKKDYSVKAIEKSKKQLQTKLEKLLNPKSASKAKDDLLEFEQLGFDYLVCDEAHAYKNGFVTTKMTNVSGVTTRPSGRAEDMQMKTDYFNEQFGQGHILFATGTPVSNSMTELYVMTRYLRPDLLKQAGIERFDDWAATFGNVVTKNQQTADGTLKMKTSFSSFANLPELMAMYKEFADVQSADKLNLPRPELKTGKPQIISVLATPEQKMYVRELAERAKTIENGSVDPRVDNHLKVTSEARLIGLGNNAVKALYEKRGEELPYDFIDDKNSKIDKCIEKVAEIYNSTNETKGVQIIFSDIAVNSDNGNFSVYDYLKTELIAKGIPEDEIIFAPKADSKERENIFRDINDSKYRVVIASTGTLGTGANIQQNLCALHHVDVPWKPSDFEQREGRILRQGNKNKEVEIFNYVTEGTLDSYLYQTVTNKARFIAQLMDDKAPARVSEDYDEKVLTYGEIQAAAEGNPDFRRRIEVSNEIAELTMLKNEYSHETAIAKEKIETIPKQIHMQKEILSHVQNDMKSSKKIREIALSGTTKNSDYIVMTREKVNAYLLKMAQEKLSNPEKEISSININNFEVSVNYDAKKEEVLFVVKGESTYSCIAGTTENHDNYQRLQNIFEKAIPKKEQEIIENISALENNLEQAKERAEMPFLHESELEEKIEEFQKLEEKLSGLSVQEDVVFDPEEEPIIESTEEKSARESIYNVDENDYQPTENDDNSRHIKH